MKDLRAILVCVDYADILALTLPYNRHHFSEVMVVTALEDHDTKRVAAVNDCRVYSTDSFYDDGADFNKWKALEEGLDRLGRYGWLCIMDADVLWPKNLGDWEPTKGFLHTPLRHNCPDLKVVPEDRWGHYPQHRNTREWAGYTQIFHADDPVLGPPPWHEQNWKHAGGADSFFQRKWPRARKVRPPWRVLHLGPHGRNWCGRWTPKADGTVLEEAEERKRKFHNMVASRQAHGNPYTNPKERI